MRGGSKDAGRKQNYQSSGEGRNHIASLTELHETKRRDHADYKPTTMFSLLGDRNMGTDK